MFETRKEELQKEAHSERSRSMRSGYDNSLDPLMITKENIFHLSSTCHAY